MNKGVVLYVGPRPNADAVYVAFSQEARVKTNIGSITNVEEQRERCNKSHLSNKGMQELHRIG